MSKQETNEKKAMIQTTILSVILPFGFVFTVLCAFGDITDSPIWVRYLARVNMAAVPALYYFVVMKKRKDDTLLDSHTRRIWRSILIQTGIMLGLFVIPLGYAVFFTQPENGHWSGEECIYLFFALLEPLLVHLGGCIFRLIFGRKTTKL